MSSPEELSSVTLLIATPSSESASELVEILPTCGLPSELTRLNGRKLKVVCPDELELEARLADVVRAVQMWLYSPDAPESVEIKGGEETVVVAHPAGLVEAQPDLRPLSP